MEFRKADNLSHFDRKILNDADDSLIMSSTFDKRWEVLKVQKLRDIFYVKPEIRILSRKP